MFDSLHISSYRFFDEKGAQFRDVPFVSYLVGQNGSGKSSVLRYLLENYVKLNPYFIHDSISVSQIFSLLDERALCQKMEPQQVFNYFTNKNELIPELCAFIKQDYPSIWQQSMYIARAAGLEIHDSFFSKNIQNLPAESSLQNPQVQTSQPQKLDTKMSLDTKILGGHDRLLLLIFACVFAVSSLNSRLILIENPENNLYPGSQKHIPLILQIIANSLHVQIFVTTHSPFLMSGLAQLTPSKNPQTVASKVYFLDQGRVVDKKGLPSVKAQYGYWGGKVVDIAGKMLGSGLSDFVSSQPQKQYPLTPTIVLCEGEGDFSDARIYNRIFAGKQPPITFISSKGVSQLERSYSLLAQVKNGLSSEFRLLMLRDRDHEFPSQQEVTSWLVEYKNGRVLYRRALEAYIFTEEIAEKLMLHFGRTLTDSDRKKVRLVNDKIQLEAQEGQQGDDYKHELEKTFHQATDRLSLRHASNNESIMMYLARFVTPDTQAYQELVDILQ